MLHDAVSVFVVSYANSKFSAKVHDFFLFSKNKVFDGVLGDLSCMFWGDWVKYGAKNLGISGILSNFAP